MTDYCIRRRVRFELLMLEKRRNKKIGDRHKTISRGTSWFIRITKNTKKQGGSKMATYLTFPSVKSGGFVVLKYLGVHVLISLFRWQSFITWGNI